jgi:sulfur carrier protein
VITIYVNNSSREVRPNTTVSEILSQLDILSKGIAIAINENIILKGEWNSTVVNSNDNILIIKATQGG